jgi:beta-lactamase regulating signal transducer with metallopeptidase domain
MTGWLFDTLLYTGLLIGLVLLVRRPASRLLGPQFAYALWALPFLRLLLPPIVLPASLAPQSDAESVQTAIAQTQSSELVQVSAVLPLPDAAPVATQQPAAELAVAPLPSWSWEDVAGFTLSVWLGVALAFLIWRVTTYRKMRRELLARARPVGEAGDVRLVETPAVAAPVAFGVLDKVVALPPRFMAQHDRLARDLAIEHELAHHRGHDLLANFAAQAVLALHWFNPLAWAGWRAMRRDQEAACDARVVAGRGREERVRYAALIAGAAAGPRSIAFNGALAAPMAGPLFGEKSIIHRLRSLSMSDITNRRRRLGYGLIAAGALALPLTASFTYSAAEAQVPEPSAPPAPPAPPMPPAPEAAPIAPEPPAPPSARGEDEGDRSDFARQFRFDHDGSVPPVPPIPPMPPVPHFEFEGWSGADDPEFEAKMEQFGREMEEWGRKFGEQYAAQAQAHALEAARHTPEVVESCDENEARRTRTADGRPRVVICKSQIQLAAREGLRQARAAIERNRALSEEMRAEIVKDLDREIERIERDRD